MSKGQRYWLTCGREWDSVGMSERRKYRTKVLVNSWRRDWGSVGMSKRREYRIKMLVNSYRSDWDSVGRRECIEWRCKLTTVAGIRTAEERRTYRMKVVVNSCSRDWGSVPQEWVRKESTEWRNWFTLGEGTGIFKDPYTYPQWPETHVHHWSVPPPSPWAGRCTVWLAGLWASCTWRHPPKGTQTSARLTWWDKTPPCSTHTPSHKWGWCGWRNPQLELRKHVAS